MRKVQMTSAAVAILASITAVNAANTISGSLWHVPEATSKNAIPANVPGSTPDVSFDVLSPFNFSGTSVSVGTWLGSSGAFNVTENTGGTLASLMDNGSEGTLVDFKGLVSVFNGETFTVTHDDGLTLIIGGNDLGFDPGPTAPTVTTATYTGPTGTFPFELVYGECCGGPAVLQVELPFKNTPDGGSTLALLGSALLGVAVMRKRFAR